MDINAPQVTLILLALTIFGGLLVITGIDDWLKERRRKRAEKRRLDEATRAYSLTYLYTRQHSDSCQCFGCRAKRGNL